MFSNIKFYIPAHPKFWMIRETIARLRTSITTPRCCDNSDFETRYNKSHLHKVGQSKPSVSSRIISFASAARVARLLEHNKTLTTGLFATRSGWETITAGCFPSGKVQVKISHCFIRRIQSVSGAPQIPALALHHVVFDIPELEHLSVKVVDSNNPPVDISLPKPLGPRARLRCGLQISQNGSIGR